MALGGIFQVIPALMCYLVFLTKSLTGQYHWYCIALGRYHGNYMAALGWYHGFHDDQEWFCMVQQGMGCVNRGIMRDYTITGRGPNGSAAQLSILSWAVAKPANLALNTLLTKFTFPPTLVIQNCQKSLKNKFEKNITLCSGRCWKGVHEIWPHHFYSIWMLIYQQ